MRLSSVLLTEILRAFEDADTEALPIFGGLESDEVLHTYTRAQAIEDGVLIDVSSHAKDCGIAYPAAFTAGVWAEAIASLDGSSDKMEESWRIRRLLDAAMKRLEETRDQSVLVEHSFYRGSINLKLKAVVSRGDDGNFVLTLMQEHED